MICMLLTSLLYAVAGVSSSLVPMTFPSLPLGAVKPSGWLLDQLTVQTNGLAGHEMDFYDYVANSDWIGGTSYYSDLEEAGSYWFNGLVPNGVLMQDAKILNQTEYFLNYVLDHQDSSGWLGPEVGTNKPRYLWGRYPFFFGAIQMTEANPAITDKVVTAMHKFVSVANTMLNKGEGVEDWTKTRWGDFVMILEWLYEFHPNNTESLLLETMQLVKNAGDQWSEVFLPENFPTAAVQTTPLTWHGVNMAEGLKAGPATYRYTHNETELNITSTGWDLLFQYHGRPSGIYSADEYLAGLEAVRGTELCLVVETMFSGSYLYQVTGDPKYPDRVERIAYNALPGTLTGSMWSRQYLQQENQIAAQNMTPNPFPNDGPYSNVFGLEPNYPCCTVNHPQGFPKFISNAFVTAPDNNTLVQVYLGPFTANTTLSNGNRVSTVVDTIYPFSDTLSATISAEKPFTYKIRIPSWISNGTVSLNQSSAQPVNPINGLHTIPVPAGVTTFTMHLPAEITIESRPNSSVAVHRGALHYAYDIPRNETVLARNAQESNAVDLQFEATSAWHYAIDPDTLVFHDSSSPDVNLPSPVFDSNQPPVKMTVLSCPIAWPTAGDTFVSSSPTDPICIGAVTNITLWPYGATKLRISEFPTFKST